MTCVFCDIVNDARPALTVFEDDMTLAFLDIRPLFPGHILVIPKEHHPTIGELPPIQVGPLFEVVRKLTGAVEAGMEAEGTFVAVNNRVSQSVPHLHVHVVPRTKGDGLKGFFWPRNPYRDQQHMAETRYRIAAAIE